MKRETNAVEFFQKMSAHFDAERYTIQQQAEQLKAWRRTCLEAMAWCARGEAKRAHQILQQKFNS